MKGCNQTYVADIDWKRFCLILAMVVMVVCNLKVIMILHAAHKTLGYRFFLILTIGLQVSWSYSK